MSQIKISFMDVAINIQDSNTNTDELLKQGMKIINSLVPERVKIYQMEIEHAEDIPGHKPDDATPKIKPDIPIISVMHG